MKAGNSAVNLSIDSDIATAMKAYVAGNRRKGRRNISELTETLWIGHLRRKGVTLPPLLKKSAGARNGHASSPPTL